MCTVVRKKTFFTCTCQKTDRWGFFAVECGVRVAVASHLPFVSIPFGALQVLSRLDFASGSKARYLGNVTMVQFARLYSVDSGG